MTEPVSWRDYVDMRFAEMDKRTAAALAAVDKNALKSEGQMEKRFDAMNEFRGQLSDQVKTFISRETYDAHHAAIVSRVEIAEKALVAGASERTGGRQVVSSIYGAAGFIVALLVIGGVLAAAGVFK